MQRNVDYSWYFFCLFWNNWHSLCKSYKYEKFLNWQPCTLPPKHKKQQQQKKIRTKSIIFLSHISGVVSNFVFLFQLLCFSFLTNSRRHLFLATILLFVWMWEAGVCIYWHTYLKKFLLIKKKINLCNVFFHNHSLYLKWVKKNSKIHIYWF